MSKGDEALLDLPGAMPGISPRIATAAIAVTTRPTARRNPVNRLKSCGRQGAQYLLIPATARWWSIIIGNSASISCNVAPGASRAWCSIVSLEGDRVDAKGDVR